jgi:hypothetical protein
MPNSPTFYSRFSANMALLGLEAPESFFGTLEKATFHIGALATTVKLHGAEQLTLNQLYRAAPTVARAPVLAALAVRMGGIYSAFYVGAAIGSLAVAAGETPSVRSFLLTANQARVAPAPWLLPTLAKVAALVNAHPVRRVPR